MLVVFQASSYDGDAARSCQIPIPFPGEHVACTVTKWIKVLAEHAWVRNGNWKAQEQNRGNSRTEGSDDNTHTPLAEYNYVYHSNVSRMTSSPLLSDTIAINLGDSLERYWGHIVRTV
jgi:hypothetical protein